MKEVRHYALVLLACSWLAYALLQALPARADSCIIIGDSIAVGLGREMPECQTDAAVGRHAWQVGPFPASLLTIISIGSNDRPTDAGEMLLLRTRIRGVVIWIMPAVAYAQRAVLAISGDYGDRTVSFRPGPDGIHPRSYPELAAAVRSAWQ